MFTETGLSNFHKMVVTIMKTTFRKLKPKIINYKNVSNDIFRDTLLKSYCKIELITMMMDLITS